MRKMYSEKEKIKHAINAYESGNILNYSIENNIPQTTVYEWVGKYYYRKSVNISTRISIYCNDSEKLKIMNLHEKYGFNNSLSTTIKDILFANKVFSNDPKKLYTTLFKLQNDLGKLASNVNQIARYFNFVGQKGDIEISKIDQVLDLEKEIIKMNKTILNHIKKI